MKKFLTGLLVTIMIGTALAGGHFGYKEFKKDRYTMQTASASYQNMITQLEKDIADSLATVSELEATIELNGLEISTLTQSVVTYKNQVGTLQDTIVQKTNDISVKEADIKTKNEQISKLNEEKTALQNDVSAKTTEITKLNSNIEEKEDMIEELSASVIAKDEEIAELNSQIEALKSEKTTLEATIVEKNSEINSKNEQIEVLTEEISALENENAELKQDKANLESVVAEKNADIDEAFATISEKDAEIENLTTSLADKQATIDELNARIEELSVKVAELEASGTTKDEEIASLNSQIIELQTEISDLNSQIETLNATIFDLNARIDILEETIANGGTFEKDPNKTYIDSFLGYSYKIMDLNDEYYLFVSKDNANPGIFNVSKSNYEVNTIFIPTKGMNNICNDENGNYFLSNNSNDPAYFLDIDTLSITELNLTDNGYLGQLYIKTFDKGVYFSSSTNICCLYYLDYSDNSVSEIGLFGGRSKIFKDNNGVALFQNYNSQETNNINEFYYIDENGNVNRISTTFNKTIGFSNCFVSSNNRMFLYNVMNTNGVMVFDANNNFSYKYFDNGYKISSVIENEQKTGCIIQINGGGKLLYDYSTETLTAYVEK